MKWQKYIENSCFAILSTHHLRKYTYLIVFSVYVYICTYVNAWTHQVILSSHSHTYTDIHIQRHKFFLFRQWKSSAIHTSLCVRYLQLSLTYLLNLVSKCASFGLNICGTKGVTYSFKTFDNATWTSLYTYYGKFG